jgi:phasin
MDEHLKMEMPKMEMPQQIREMAETTINQAEKSFGAFMDAANRSVSILPSPASDLPMKALSISEQNMKSAFDHARDLLRARDVQDVMRIQAEFLRAQFEAATEQLRQLGSGLRFSGEH